MTSGVIKKLHDQLSSHEAPDYVLNALLKWIKEFETSGMSEGVGARDSVTMKTVTITGR